MKERREYPKMGRESEQPEDWLPDGTENEPYLKIDKEWPSLERRIGKPRILNNPHISEVFKWIKKNFGDNPEDLSYFEAGCGHGNDLRAMMKALDGKGHFRGVDMSVAEIERGLEFYQQQENSEEARKLFAQGDLRDLAHINIYDDETGQFSQPTGIKDGEFDTVYMEAILHGFGYGKKTFQEKKDSAQQMLDELGRICKVGGRFFGRANTFGPTLTREKMLELQRETNNWRFIPESEEFEEMLEQSGFTDIQKILTPHERAKEDPNKSNIVRFSFLATK